MEMHTLNGKELSLLANANETAKAVIGSLAQRERLRHFTDITRTKTNLVRAGERIIDGDYMEFWKGLQKAGVGSIIYGRRGKPDRFEWHYSLKSVAKSAIDGTNEETKILKQSEVVQEAAPLKKKRGPKPGTKYKKRASKILALSQSEKCSPEEIEVFMKVVKKLLF